ncbi:MAG: hypothetical protein NC079_00575 [Clostridium sp.]|nr:hypothetical protein [Acetatifactor muris]MCM1527469.1 hypothetical protein [Bacteroides sp.]MCM1562085.1 hypothetical protein [Clostridium sp.]
MEQMLNAYYADNASKLHRTVDRILQKYGGLSGKDRDDFYSLANEVFAEAIKRYDRSQTFDGFLYICLNNRIKTEITRRNREKRKVDRVCISMDMPIGDDEDSTLADVITDDFNLEETVLAGSNEGYGKRLSAYLARLSELQRRVLRLDAAGYLPHEIREKLQITERQYADCNAAIHSYRNISLLL